MGDLHGCYSCLKGAVMQTNFLEHVEKYRNDPENTPYPLLVNFDAPDSNVACSRRRPGGFLLRT